MRFQASFGNTGNDQDPVRWNSSGYSRHPKIGWYPGGCLSSNSHWNPPLINAEQIPITASAAIKIMHMTVRRPVSRRPRKS